MTETDKILAAAIAEERHLSRSEWCAIAFEMQRLTAPLVGERPLEGPVPPHAPPAHRTFGC